MKINFLCNGFNNNKQKTFKAHPDYKLLAKDYEIKASSYFRRGGFYGSPSNDFVDVIKILNSIFGQIDFGKKKMFIAGIGDSQEPFSLLAVIKNIIKNKSLKDALDLYIADLQSKPANKKLFEQSFFDCHICLMPNYARDSFIRDDREKPELSYTRFRVKDEIFDFLKQTYNNRKQSYWNSRVQDVVKKMADEQYDIISINNTLGYIRDKNVVAETLNNIKRIIKKDGVFITDPYNKYDNLKDVMEEEYAGIFRKI